MSIPEPPYHNVTDRLLYEILNNLNKPAPPPPPVIYNQFNVLYVSARYGDDSTAERNNISKPFQTITMARLNAFYGDVIHVLEGIYDEANLFCNNKMWFDHGAVVSYSGNGIIFQQMYGECTVRGYGVFKCTGTGSVINVGNWYNCVLDIECESIEAVQKACVLWQNRDLHDPTNYKPHRIKAKRCYSSGTAALHLQFNCHILTEIDEIVSDGSQLYCLYVTNPRKGLIRNSTITSSGSMAVYMDRVLELEYNNCRITCNYDSPNGHAIYSSGIFMHNLLFKNCRIECVNPNAKSIYTEGELPLYLDKNVFATNDTNGPIDYMVTGTKLNLVNNEVTVNVYGESEVSLYPYQNAEIIRIASNDPNVTIAALPFAPKHHSFKIVPVAPLVVTMNSTDPATAQDKNIILESSTIHLDGSKGDWIEFYNGIYGTGNRQINAANY